MGYSLDWTRERFTMDPGMSRAVREVFVQLWEQGLIYRGYYIVNWCPRCVTALSDLEVETETEPGSLWHIRYAETDGKPGIVVATTRPETLLGDTAVAVHPDDERYRHLIGKTVVLPVLGREIPVVADAFVDREFGTGAVKLTPAHDANDFAAAQRLGLPSINIMDERAVLNENAGPYAGQDRFEARKGIVAQLEKRGPARQDGAAPGPARPLPALRHDRGAAAVAPVVREDGAPGRARPRRGGGRAHPLRARELDQDLLRMDAQHPRLVHLAPALVGPSHPGLDLREVRGADGGARGARRLPEVRRHGARPGDGRARHLVLLRPLPVLHAGLAGQDAGPRRATTRTT